ncbi:sensor histidine kinase [Alkalicoccobacillus porphyridii]|uniref:sensor histidine kinase n=1 Tax=Alkalicoccobacillus porphyridii TaxID=2597270 RepID=UPI00163D5942|nr:histidine kinase [Alkalicoccobacillus porphyridii]
MKYSFSGMALAIICMILEQTSMIVSYEFWLFMGVFVAFFSSKRLWTSPIIFFSILVSIFGCIHLFILPPAIYSPYILYYIFAIMYSLDKNHASILPLILSGFLLSTHALYFSFDLAFALFMIMQYVIFLSTLYLIKKLTISNQKYQADHHAYLSEYRKMNRQLRDQEQSAAAKERNRIARDLHDSVGHQLTALMMQLQMVEFQLSSMPDQQRLLKQSKDMARQSLQEMRESVHALQIESVKGIEAVIQLIRKLEAESHVRVQLVTKPQAMSIILNEEQNVAVYRFIQEGLTNAMRHAHTREVELTLEVIGEHSYGLRMSNRVYQAIWKEGFGLKNLRARFISLNGQFQAGIKRDQFEIRGSFPIKRMNEGREV